eukprot:Protomagalhaensia_wolfi_Nauph_80__2201@NODE_2423_length_1096_cov_13_558184_g1871_i1_p1_GENE_NODE_2423_length_1096_cov_13_558184_g1871_i1NODE_2423_length_1096_cov_13_558184_g1871_i1_p1_ORF_typecomplete_len218_score27_54_NODE_2423_length_1096_cov_13_558184_g1871_i169722
MGRFYWPGKKDQRLIEFPGLTWHIVVATISSRDPGSFLECQVVVKPLETHFSHEDLRKVEDGWEMIMEELRRGPFSVNAVERCVFALKADPEFRERCLSHPYTLISLAEGKNTDIKKSQQVPFDTVTVPCWREFCSWQFITGRSDQRVIRDMRENWVNEWTEQIRGRLHQMGFRPTIREGEFGLSPCMYVKAEYSKIYLLGETWATIIARSDQTWFW